jgi:glutamyl-tRNA reductase
MRFHSGMRTEPVAEQFRHEALLRALKELRNGASPVEVAERLSQRLTGKLLHAPTKALA